MKKSLLYSLLFLFPISHFCYAQEEAGKTKILARINDYNLTLDEFQYQLSGEAELHKDFKLTKEAKKEFLEGLIRRQLLIQEAERLGLDKKEKFIKELEYDREQNLIRDLLQMKGKGINLTTCVSQDEIACCYRRMKESGEKVPPLGEIEKHVAKEVKERKSCRTLKEWIESLSKKAKIEINQELLYEN